MKYGGIDLHKLIIVLSVMNQERKVLERKTFRCQDTEQIRDYFAKLGHPCPQYTNPADFAMDLINTDFEGEHNKVRQRMVHLLARNRSH